MTEFCISVIVPVFNTGKFLYQCLDSLYHQELKNIEIICIDDGSTDTLTLKILEDFSHQDSRISIYRQKNSGPGAARNKGIIHAKGKYIAFIDSDDYISYDFLKELYICAHNTNALIAATKHIILFTNQNKNIDKYLMQEFPIGQLSSEQCLIQFLETGSCCNKIYERKFILNNNIRFLENTSCSSEDNFFTILASIYARNRFYIIDKPIYFYRQHDSSITKNITVKNFTDISDIYRKITYKIRKSNFTEKNYLLNFIRKRFEVDYTRTYSIATKNGYTVEKISKIFQHNPSLNYEVDILIIDSNKDLIFEEILSGKGNFFDNKIKISIVVLSTNKPSHQYYTTIGNHHCFIKIIQTEITPPCTIDGLKVLIPLLRKLFKHTDRCLYMADLKYLSNDILDFYQTCLENVSHVIQCRPDNAQPMVLLKLS